MIVIFEEEYDLDIFQAILSIRAVEGDKFLMSIVIPNQVYEFIRFKKYPYKESCLPSLIDKYKDVNKAVSIFYNKRVNPYLKDYIYLDDEREDHWYDF